jgi:RNA polymerase sigma factor (TIGR02999 family)
MADDRTDSGGATRVTELLSACAGGDREALGHLLPLVYHELRAIARRHLWRERPGHTLQPTALVNEAYLRLVDQREARWHSRTHFFAVASQAMRRILVDYARTKLAEKRGGGVPVLTLGAAADAGGEAPLGPEDLLALDAALGELAALDPQQARIVELRYFADLTIEECGQSLGISPATVKREWAMARAWLHRRISGDAPDGR